MVSAAGMIHRIHRMNIDADIVRCRAAVRGLKAAWLFVLMAAMACTAQPLAPPPPAAMASAKVSSGTSSTAKFPPTLVISVLYFEDRTRVPDLAWMRKGLADMLVAELARIPSVLVVQRQRLEEVVREQTLHLSGRVADESAVRVGRLAGATVLVTGSVTVVEGQVRIDAQMLGVEQGTILGTAVAEGRLAEVSSVARSLVAKVVELLPDTGHRQTETATTATTDPKPGFVPAAKANDVGEMLSREGKMFQALEEFERALAADPTHSSARSNYADAVRSLSGPELLKTGPVEEASGGDRLVVARLVERLAGSGLEAETAQARTERAKDGSLTLRVPVRFRLLSSAVDAVAESTRAMGGIIRQKAGGNGVPAAVEVALSSRADLSRDFVRGVAVPRRVYLRLLAKDGKTLAIYSSLQDWRLSTWVLPVDDQRVRIESGLVLAAEGVFSGLTPEQVATVEGVKMTVDAVPRERAIVSLDASAAEGQPPARDRSRQRTPPTDYSDAPAIRSLRAMLERSWNPPVAERPWGRGYLPGNEREAVVIAVLEAGRPEMREEPHLVHSSGDPDFDLAAVRAATATLKNWLVESGAGSFGTGASATDGQKNRAVKLRAQFRLIKDVPALNLIGPLGPGSRPWPVVRTEEPGPPSVQ